MRKSEVPLPLLPGGTVTFLFTDIEGSTELLERLREQYTILLADQREILRGAFKKWNGHEVDTQGDAFFVAFPRATDAVKAAVEAQRALAEHAWPEGEEVRVRMGLHTGEPLEISQEGYVGVDVHRAARIAHVGHGAQVLLSETTTPLVRDELPGGVSLLNLGRHRLKDMRRPERIHQLDIEGLPAEFPPLNSLEALPPEVPINMGPVKLPSFLEEMEEAPAPVFVGRECELEELDGFLQKALDGQGGLAFVIGGPGRGKTALLEAFSRRASEARADLLVVWGECSAYTGMGDPYLPFRQIMRMLTGDLESRWAARRIARREATRLWEAMPVVAREVVEVGPDLIDVFVTGRGLLSRVRRAVEGSAPWIERLATYTEGERPSSSGLDQRNLFDQVEVVLAEIAERNPLVLVLDDLQWADSASISLLFHLGRRLAGRRILIVGAYRPEEVALGRGYEPHPLQPVLAELKRQYGDAWIDLGTVQDEEGRSFVESYLDSEPNRLSEGFRKALFMHTGGHPLFTIELLRDLQERGDLILDEESRWVEGRELDWSVLPARVEGVIEERIGRLEEALRETLNIASVEGEDFTAQVVARVQQVGERKLIKRLSRELEKKHRLVRAQDEARVGEHYLSRYRFTHLLFQRFLYNDLSAAERRTMHGEVGRVLEELYAGETEAITVQLAHHYAEAGETDKAIEYLQKAGDKARVSYAHEEAISHYQQALEFLKEKREFERAARTLMKLGLTFQTALDFRSANQAFEEAFSLRQQRDEVELISSTRLSRQVFRFPIGEPHTLDPSLGQTKNAEIVIAHLFSGLVELRPDMSIVPDVAIGWEILNQGRKWIFKLRDDVLWSDGGLVTAADFEFAWKRVLDPATQSVNAKLLYEIQGAKSYNLGEVSDPNCVGVQALDATTLSVDLEQPTGHLLHLIADCATFPLPRHVVRKHGDDWTDVDKIVTNGPFLLDNWDVGKRIVLSRNPKYHGRFRGNLEQVELVFPSSSSNLEMYESDELDIVPLSYNDLDRSKRKHPEEYVFLPTLTTFFIGFNVRCPPFDDVRIRRAFVLATDREEYANVILKGGKKPATGGFIPPGMPGHSATIGLPYDPVRAQELLFEPGYSKGSNFPKVEGMVEAFPHSRQRWWSWLVDHWKNTLDVEIISHSLKWRAFISRLEKDPPNIFSCSWTADYPDPDSFLRTSTIEQYTGWKNDTYDHLIERARRRLDQSERIKLYQEAERILIEEAPVMPLTYMQAHLLIKPWVRRFPLSTIFRFYSTDIIIDPQ